jgi:hypothetical protein
MHPRHRNESDGHHARPPETRWAPIDTAPSLSESGVIRLRQTRIRLHPHNAEPVVVALLDIVGVTSWDDVAILVKSVRPIDVRGERRMAFAAGVILWAEVLAEVDA